MALKLMYITNRTDVAKVAQNAGVDRIFIDLEYIGKADRQGGMDTVQNRHTIEDIKAVRKVVDKSELLVRINPIHNATGEYTSSKEEIDNVIEAGADIIMLPFFKSVEEVKQFIRLVDKRAKTMLLVETPQAVDVIDDILNVEGIDSVHIGLNDLSLGYGIKFMFGLIADGTVERVCLKCKQKGIPYGFGGIAALGKGMLSADYIIKEHYKLGSTCTILSRSFCNTELIQNIDEIKNIFDDGIKAIRQLEEECKIHADFFDDNERKMNEIISNIINTINEK
ncbi:MAG: aldolase [Lachnospiraceae bacterium]|nr:aldolase [Lachnospiraceae bacterium]